MKFTTLEQLFSNEKRWTKGAAARDIRGRDDEIESNSSVAWCLVGGISKVYKTRYDEIYTIIAKRLLNINWKTCLSSYNDKDERTIGEIREIVKGL